MEMFILLHDCIINAGALASRTRKLRLIDERAGKVYCNIFFLNVKAQRNRKM